MGSCLRQSQVRLLTQKHVPVDKERRLPWAVCSLRTLPPTNAFQVEDLFYNVPTRRRAFRSASEEYNKILDLVGRYAIHCSGVAFSCKKHGDASTSISIAAHANTVDRIRQIHGSAVASQLLDLSIESDCWGFKSSGWISNANYHVKKLILMLFINHRSVESSTIKKAVEQTYALFLPKGGHPFIYLSLEIDPHRLDVNVHPTKREVNFLNEDEIIETVCEEIRVRLGKVDDSRTFFTQSLIPGVNIPTISRNSTIESVQDLDPPDTPSTAAPMPMQSTKRTPASRPYENNLVRTDSKARKITTMFSTTPRVDSPTRRLSEDPRNATPSTYQADGVGLLLEDVNTYSYVDREYVICRLSTIKELKANVRLSMHNAMTEIFTSHIFVGVVDEHRRIAAIQSGVKLFLVDYGMLCNEYFYQLGLTDFGNFGTIKLEPSLNLRELLKIAAESEEQNTPQEDAEGMDWKEVVDTVHDHLVERRQMIAEYFSVNISAEGDIHGLPLLVKGYMPSMGKLPQFLLRLGPHVDWTDEKACFRTFLRELASWYVPEALPVTQTQPEEDPNGMNRNEMDTNENETYATLKEAKAVGRRKDINRALEHVIFPAFKARLIGTKGMLKGIVEVADLKGLYRVFERC